MENIHPDLIILDVMMPEMDGIEVCRRLKNNPQSQHIPVLMVTALNTKEDLARCLEEGADDYLSKPIEGVELKARVRSLLRVKRQYDQLQNLIQLREEALRLREDLSKMIVHDLRNPLVGMLLGVEVALRYLDQFDQSEFSALKKKVIKKLHQVLGSGRQVQQMVEDLLLMAKLESGKMRLNLGETDLYKLCLESFQGFQEIAKENRLYLQVDAPKTPQYFQVDAPILRRVIDNLLSNAIKFSPPDAKVVLKLEPLSERHFRLSVADQGPGIKPEDREKIFDKFEIGAFKAHKSQTGLGLAFCKLAVEAHQGSIGLMDNQPKGTIFWLEI
jgi:signal transduction histidine kinase